MADSKPEITPLDASKWRPGQSGNPGGRPSQAALRAALKPHEKKALETIVECLDSESDKVRLSAAQEILNRLYGKIEAGKESPSWLKDEEIVEMLS